MTQPSFKTVGKFLLWGLGLVLVGWLFLLFTQFLWNALAVAVFGLPALSYLQLIGLMILGRLLTGGFGGRGRGWRGRPGGWKGGWPSRDRWHQMTDADRLEFKNDWRGKRGCGWQQAEKTGPDEPAVS